MLVSALQFSCCKIQKTFFFDQLTTFAYVTYEDINHLGNLHDQTVIVVKAPTDTKLEVPDPDEVCVQTVRDVILVLVKSS